MKTRRFLTLIAAVLSPAALILFGCSKTDNSTKMAQDAKAAASSAVSDVGVAASDSWDSIKDFSFERRADFSAAMDRMAKELDDKTAALKAKVAGVPDEASRERASAMQDYDSARADLKARLTDLGNATADTWANAKAKADAAWNKVRDASDRVTKANAAP